MANDPLKHGFNPSAPKTYEQGLREAFEAVRELVRKNYSGSEAKSFRHAFWRELRRAAASMGIQLDAPQGEEKGR